MDGGDSFGTVSCMCGVVFGVVLRTSRISARVMFASFLILTSWLIRHLGQSWSCLILTHDTWRRRQALLEEIGPVSHWDTGWRFEHALHLQCLSHFALWPVCMHQITWNSSDTVNECNDSRLRARLPCAAMSVKASDIRFKGSFSPLDLENIILFFSVMNRGEGIYTEVCFIFQA